MESQLVLRWLLAVVLHSVVLQSGLHLNPKPVAVDELVGDSSQPWSGPADRVVLFVVSGLRADSLLSRVDSARFLRDAVKKTGSWGISFGASPTMNGRGLGVIATGLPDGSLASSGADNLFKHSHTLYIGPPTPGRPFQQHFAHQCSFPAVWEHPELNPNQTQADEWVFVHYDTLWAEPHLQHCLRAEKVIFLVYLSGLDIASQLEGVHSKRLDTETAYILDGLERAFRRTEMYYTDKRTAYLLTSDHGFRHSKEHGTEIENEELLPIVAWGAGVSGPMDGRSGTPSVWGLDGLRRRDMDQKDIASLIASLLGITIPSTSFGNVPLSYLRNVETKAKAVHSNAVQLSRLYGRATGLLGSPMASIWAPLDAGSAKVTLEAAARAIRLGDYGTAITLCQTLSESALSGIDYYRWYEARLVSICTALGLIGWTLLCFGWILEKLKVTPVLQREMPPRSEEAPKEGARRYLGRFITLPVLVDLGTIVVIGGALTALFFDNSPLSLYPSVLLCIFILWLVVRHIPTWSRLYKSFLAIEVHIPLSKPLMHGSYFIIFSYFLDNSLILHVMFAFGLVFTSLSDLRHSPGPQLAFWLLTSLPFLLLLHQTPLPPQPYFLIPSACVWLTAIAIIVQFLRVSYMDWPIFLAGFFSLVLIVIHAQYGPPSATTHFILTWCPISLVLFIPLIGSSSLPIRFAEIILCFSIPVFILSITNEPFSLLLILCHYFAWFLLEGYESFSEFQASKISTSTQMKPIDWNNIRRTFYFVTYLLITFRALGTPVDPSSWPDAWPSYFLSSQSPAVYLLVIGKFLPLVIIFTVLLMILEKSNPMGSQASSLFLTSLISLVHFLLAASASSSHIIFLQICIILFLIAQPLSYVLLSPSIFRLFLPAVRPPPIDPIPLETVPIPVGPS